MAADSTSTPPPATPPSIHGPALSGWQFHQSHGQVTVVFYVSLSARDDDLEIVIGSNHVIAGIRGYEPVLKAATYARIDPAHSSWQLERPPASSSRRSHSNSRSRSSHRVRTRQASSDHDSGSSSGSNQGISSNSTPASRYYRREPLHEGTSNTTTIPRATVRRAASNSSSNGTSNSNGSSSHSDHLQDGSIVLLDSRPASPTLSSPGSFEVLQNSTESLRTSSTGTSSPRSSTSTRDSRDSFVGISHHPHQEDVPDSASTVTEGTQREARTPTSQPSSPRSPRSPQSQSSRGSLPSIESDGEGEAGRAHAPLSSSSYAGVSSMQSSMHLSSTASSSQPSGGDDAPDHLAARLVTIHLTKIDAGMWPMLISGPAPLSETTAEEDDFEGSESTESSSSRHSFQSDDDSGTILDDSGTVLADRGPSLSTLVDGHGLEAKFNMDPISLVLMGFQVRAAAPPLRRTGLDEAFEYFARSWRKIDLPVATRVLVQEYLPLVAEPAKEDSESDDSDGGEKGRAPAKSAATDAGRPRMIAALGGHTALARLYVSYARLNMPSPHGGTGQHHSYLFPSGPGHSRDPYSGFLLGGDAVGGGLYDVSSPDTRSPSSGPSSPQSHVQPPGSLSRAEHTVAFGPLAYLEQAQALDANVAIHAADLVEAKAIYESAVLEADAEATADDLSAREGESTGYFSGSGMEDDLGGQARRRQVRRRRKRKEREASRRKKQPQSSHDGGLVVVLSGAALVSFAVAGSVAMLGWWKRAGGASGSGGAAGA